MGPENKEELRAIALQMVTPGKGILAADEATNNFNIRLGSIGVEGTEENRRRYRQMLIETPDLSDYISGVILNSETIEQVHDNGKLLRDILKAEGIVFGVTLDLGPTPLHGGLAGETATQGLDGLDQRCAKYKLMGAGFAKWRAIFRIDSQTGSPSTLTITENAMTLARYASVCQKHGLVPIVEPDVVMAGDHDLAKNAGVCRAVWAALFKALNDFNVYLEGTILKTNMVIAGTDCKNSYSPEEIAAATLDTLGSTVPPSMPGVVFLSGGQGEEEATKNLDAINKVQTSYPKPWKLTFCYGRALQDSAFKIWAGMDQNVHQAQEKLLERAKANGLASLGQY